MLSQVSSQSETLTLDFSVCNNKFWKCIQPEPRPQHTITSITYDSDQDADLIWLNLNSPIKFGTTECLVRIYGLPGMTGQKKQVEKAVSGEMKCSIKFQNAHQLSGMQQACRENHAYLVQETEVLHNPTLHHFEITSCNGLGSEVREAASIKSWHAALPTVHTSLNFSAFSHQHEQQATDYSFGQPSQPSRFTPLQPSTLDILPSVVLSKGPELAVPGVQGLSNKRIRSCTGPEAEEQVRGVNRVDKAQCDDAM